MLQVVILGQVKNIQPVSLPNGHPKVLTAPVRLKIGLFTRSRINLLYFPLNKTNTSVVPDLPFSRTKFMKSGHPGCGARVYPITDPAFGYFLPAIVPVREGS